MGKLNTSALMPVVTGYLFHLCAWSILVFILFPRPSLYKLIMEDMGVKKLLPSYMCGIAPGLFCAGHALLMMALFPLVLLGPLAQGLLLSCCVLSAFVRG